MFKPTLTQGAYLGEISGTHNYAYYIVFEEGLRNRIIMTEACALKFQKYIDSIHPSIEVPREPVQSAGTDHDIALSRDPYITGDNMDTHRGDYQPPVPGDDDILPGMHMDWPINAPDDRANGDYKEMDDGVTY